MSIEFWDTTTLADCISTKKGYAFKSGWYTDNGHPIVKVSNFTDDSVDVHELTQIRSELVEDYKMFALHTDDVVVQTVGSWPNNPQSVVGKAIRVPRCANGTLLNQNAVRIDPAAHINRKFLFYLLRNDDFKAYIISTAQGAASQAAITLTSLKSYKFGLPPLPTQRKIASILSAYDDLIENNTRRIAILEEMAQAIYREWFVNFRFPGHENVRLVDSPLGQIPEGWEVVNASDLLHVKPRTTVPREGEKPFVPMGAVPHNTMLIEEAEIEFRTRTSGSKFKNGDTLFARITPCLENGKTAFVNFLDSDEDVACGSTEFIVLRAKTVTPEFVYLLARSDEFRDIAIKSMTGATGRQRVQEECFDQFLLAQPSNSQLQKFSDLIRPVFQIIFSLARKNSNLRTTRDLLLPKLISGKLDVEDLDIDTGLPEEELEEAVV